MSIGGNEACGSGGGGNDNDNDNDDDDTWISCGCGFSSMADASVIIHICRSLSKTNLFDVLL